jgi:transposase
MEGHQKLAALNPYFTPISRLSLSKLLQHYIFEPPFAMPWTWDTPTRVRYKTLIEEGYSQRDAARKVGASESSGRYWFKRPDRLAKPPGTRPKISDEQLREIIQWFTGYYDRRSSTLEEIRKQFNLDCCNNTLLAAFARNGYHYHLPDCKPFLSKKNKLKR